MADENTRDYRQRSLGCFGVSMMAHVGLLALLALAPQSNALQPLGLADGTAPGAVTVDLETPATGMNEASAAAAAPEAKAAETATSAPSEVLLASNDDTNAVPLPAEKVERVEPKKIAAPIEVAKPKPAKIAARPKAKEAAPEDGDVEIKSALLAAREEEKPQELAQEEPSSQQPSEPQEPQAPPEDEEEEIETAKAEPAKEAVAAVAAAPAPEKELPASKPAPQVAAAPAQVAPTAAATSQPQAQPATANQVAAIATAPAQAMVAPVSQQAAGGATAQPGVAAAQPGAPVVGQSVRAGGLGYSVPLGVRIRDASELVARPNNPKPTYPQQDRLLGRQGTAVIIGRIGNDGSVISVQLERSSGSASMDQEAMKAFGKWKYMPGQQGLVRVPIQFQLMGAAKEMPATLRR